MKKTKKSKSTKNKTGSTKQSSRKRQAGRGKSLVIVESPAKIKTISRILGSKYLVKSSFGHIRDLPKSTFGIDIENNFQPNYITIRKQTKTVKELKKLAAQVDKLYLATDPDREGEAIAWHLSEIFNLPQEMVWRVTFDEITASAVRNAFQSPHKISMSLVNAQQARRFLDRIMGYKLSPLLWKKITKGLSAGRVQSVAMRLIVEREKEIETFKACEHWKISAEFVPILPGHKEAIIPAVLIKINDLGIGNPADNNTDIWVGSESESTKLVEYLQSSSFEVSTISRKESNQNPPPPFITSTLQQAASIKLNFSPKKTMLIAQQLYEGIDLPDGPSGLITYMRTDSVRVSEEAIKECRSFIATRYGADLVNEATRRYTPSKQSQQAHEAIRPTFVAKTPENIRQYLTGDQYKLYDLIWRRFIATQMKAATWRSKSIVIETRNNANSTIEILSNSKKNQLIAEKIVKALSEINKVQNAPDKIIAVLKKNREDEVVAKKIIEIADGSPEDKTLVIKILNILNESIDNNLIAEKIDLQRGIFSANERRLVFKGFLMLYQPEEQILPDIKEAEKMEAVQIKPIQSFTEPPPRFTEAGLVKILEKYGIGRPSTYAPIISTLEDRGYVNKNGRQLSPTELGILVNDKLVPFFDDIINTQFTARIEEELDMIEESEKDWTSTLQEFYEPFIKDLEKAENEMPSEKGKETSEKCPKCGNAIVERWSRFGKFLSCSTYPNCEYTASLKPRLIPEDTGLLCEKCGKPMVIKTNYRRSKFIACSGYPECKNAKPLPKEIIEKLAHSKQSIEEKTEENDAEPEENKTS